MKTPTIKQILLITDGCSNKGENPTNVAFEAYQKGITVNVIGVLDHDTIDEKGMSEIESIASAGGGVHQVVYTQQLSKTVQMVTRQSMNQTIQGVVNKQLQNILGKSMTIESLSPEKRGEIMEVVEDLGETSKMDILVLIDTSASMSQKLNTVKESLFDLSISLNARTGNNRFSVLLFPGKRADVDVALEWTDGLDSLNKVFKKIEMRGITPTGPAIREAINHFSPIINLNSPSEYEYENYYEETI
ncbi:MAG: hypothetical protein K0R18_3077 [Bacillales bacterium]|jgi:Ca-activated chloride channel family protein|nr:hypothetical protein [Bacillales bacterium]